MVSLTVNVDHVGAVREAARGSEPDPVAIAIMAEAAGANGIAVHLRGDRRHIQERDLRLLRELSKTTFELQIAPTDEAIGLALASRPNVATIIREADECRPVAVDLVPMEQAFKETVETLKRAEIGIAFLVEPDLKQVKAASRLGASRVELRASSFSAAFNTPREEQEMDRLAAAATMGAKLGLSVFAGGGIEYRCAARLAQIEEIEGFVVGHAIVARAVAVGIERAVSEMLSLLRSAGRG